MRPLLLSRKGLAIVGSALWLQTSSFAQTPIPTSVPLLPASDGPEATLTATASAQPPATPAAPPAVPAVPSVQPLAAQVMFQPTVMLNRFTTLEAAAAVQAPISTQPNYENIFDRQRSVPRPGTAM